MFFSRQGSEVIFRELSSTSKYSESVAECSRSESESRYDGEEEFDWFDAGKEVGADLLDVCESEDKLDDADDPEGERKMEDRPVRQLVASPFGTTQESFLEISLTLMVVFDRNGLMRLVQVKPLAKQQWFLCLEPSSL